MVVILIIKNRIYINFVQIKKSYIEVMLILFISGLRLDVCSVAKMVIIDSHKIFGRAI